MDATPLGQVKGLRCVPPTQVESSARSPELEDTTPLG